jgi:FlaA1/EpsC-like NDP-sugar epimerase
LRQLNSQSTSLDLLARPAIEISSDPAREHLRGAAVMVTGAAGSIGSALCRAIIRLEPSRLICLDRDETALFDLQQELGPHRAKYSLLDSSDSRSMEALLSKDGVQTVFHAAAYEHVPLLESNVCEAVRNNIFGLHDLLRVAEHSGCRNFILISSDKAVNPTGVMGATKRVGEPLCSQNRSSMRCVAMFWDRAAVLCR